MGRSGTATEAKRQPILSFVPMTLPIMISKSLELPESPQVE
jgi:hypothetical protein